MKTSKLSFFLMLSALVAGQLWAQNNASIGDVMRRNEISVAFARPGIGNMPFSGPVVWDKYVKSDIALGFSAGYTYWFSEHIGLASSLTLTYISNSEKTSNITSTAHGTITINQGEGTPTAATREVHTTMTINTPMVSERQSLLMLDVPVQLSLQKKHLFCNLGLAFGVSLNTYGQYTYMPSVYSITAIEDLGIDISDLPLSAVVVEGNEGSYTPASVKHPVFIEFAADLGWKFNFDNRNAVSLALSLRYALNKCNIDNNGYEIIDINRDVTTARAPMQAGLVDSFRYYVAGIKISYHLGYGLAANRK